MPDRVLGDGELVIEAEAPDLDLQKGVDRFRDLVLLASAQDTDPALRRQEDGEAGSILGLRVRSAAIENRAGVSQKSRRAGFRVAVEVC